MSIVPGSGTGEFEFIRDLVKERAAIVLDTGKAYLVESRLSSIARREGFKTVGEFVQRLRAEPYGSKHRQVVEAMTTNETSFFRDIHPFDTLRTLVVPEILQQRAKERTLTVWCAASSSGQEPYTIAMVLREHFPVLATWNVRVLATDINRQMVERSKEGRYSQLEVNRGLPVGLLVKNFIKSGNEWVIKDELRKWMEFREMNLAGPWPAMPQVDVLFIRNVLIYFDVPTKRDIMAKCRRVLRPGGYLFMGSAETTIKIDDQFERTQTEKSACYRAK